MANDGQSVGATETTLDILEALERFNEGARVTPLAEELSISKSTVSKHLQTLRDRGYVVQHDNRYRLGTRFLEFGHCVREFENLFEVARDEIEEMAEETGEKANLMIEEQGLGVYFYTAEGQQAVNLDTHPGKRVHLHTTAMGKAILSELPDERVEKVIERHGLASVTDNTISSRKALFEELAMIREHGVAYDKQERVEGMNCVAAPVTLEDRLYAAVSVTGPVSRLPVNRMESELKELVQHTANITEINLTYR